MPEQPGAVSAPAHRDRFARQSDKYAQHRPHYPAELFVYVAGLCERHELAWDCATGNGQAARGLVRHFERVVATDASAGQIAQAWKDPRVSYRVAMAHDSGLESGSADLVTIATALHWVELDGFYAEVRRVLRPRGVIAAWGYQDTSIGSDVDAALRRYRKEVVGADWAFEVRLLTERYATVPFPFDELPAPSNFAASAHWSLSDAFGYLESWSATQRFRERTGRDPVELIREELTAAWGDTDTIRDVKWPLFLRVGRNQTANP